MTTPSRSYIHCWPPSMKPECMGGRFAICLSLVSCRRLLCSEPQQSNPHRHFPTRHTRICSEGVLFRSAGTKTGEIPRSNVQRFRGDPHRGGLLSNNLQLFAGVFAATYQIATFHFLGELRHAGLLSVSGGHRLAEPGLLLRIFA